MNTKNLFRLSALLVVLLVLVAGNAFASKYYVNVVSGLDGYNGLSPAPGGVGIGPKQTIGNAITAASPGDTIIVDFGNGNLYNEVVIVNKKLVFGTSNNTGSGTPLVHTLQINNVAAAPDNIVTFTGPYQFQTALTLTQGAVIGAGNLTIGNASTAATITRNAISATVSGTVDAQLLYAGDIDFVYTTGGFNMTTGFELVAAANTTNFKNFTTTGAGIVTLNSDKTMKGVITTAGALNLGGKTLAVTGTNAHTVAGNVTNGTLAFTLSGAASVTGNFDLPVVTATASAAQTLTLNTNTKTGNLTASGSASITVAAATQVGSVTNSGSGTVTLTAAVATGALTNSSSGGIVLNAAGATIVTGAVAQSGSGSILFNSTTSNTINGAVTNNPTLTLTTAAVAAGANKGVIRFVGDFPVTISGAVTIGTTITGTATGAAILPVTNWTNTGEISFGAATALVTVNGALTVNAAHSIVFGGVTTITPTVSNNAGAVFASTTGNVIISGGITNSTNWPTVTSVTMANNGDVNMAARLGGTLGTLGSRVGAISSTSTATTDGLHGNIITGTTGVTTGGFFGTSVSTSGGKGGQTYFPDAPFNAGSFVKNSRTVSYKHIRVGTVATTAVTVTIGGNVENSGASTIAFDGFDGAVAEAFAVTGTVISSGTGTISVAGAQTGTGTFSLGGVNITSGTVDLVGVGAATMNVIVNGSTSFVGGSWKMGTTAARTLQLGGLLNNFSGAASRTDFMGTNMANVTLLIQPSSIIAGQTLTGNATAAAWPGPLTVNNPSGLQPAVTFSGGNFRVLNDVTFTSGQVKLSGITFFIGGQLTPLVGAGDLVNTAGYVTETVGSTNGFLSMNGNAAQAVSGGGPFGNFEVDAGANTVTVAGGTGDFTGTFNLTSGTTAGGANINLNNSTNPPTIVVNAGNFAVAPTFTSMVNVYYIGIDKTVGNELPAATDKLNNLTVATTNGGLTSGKGRVLINVATTVNGILDVFPNQALYVFGVDLTMKGGVINLNGDITNDAATSQLVLDAATGTTITGAGVLPDILVNAGSVGNSINGSVGLCTGLLGADGLRSPLVDDLNPGGTGSIIYAGGAASSLTVTFGTANTTTGAHLATVTTAAGATLTLGANLIEHQAGNLTHAAGTIDVATFMYTHKGVAPVMDGSAATFSGTGTLRFDLTAATTLTVNTGAGTIGTNVEVRNPANVAAFVFNLAGNNLTIAGNLTLTAGGTTGTTTFDVNALILTCTGANVTMGANTTFAATGGAGILKLNAATPPLTFSFAATNTIVNLTISNDVTLAGAGTSLTVTGILKHEGGVLNFSTRTLTVGAVGTYTHTGGTYDATTGYFVYSGVGATFQQGNTDYTIPNLRLTNGAAANMTGTGVLTVTLALDVNNGAAFTHTVSSAKKLAVADAATVNWTAGSFDAAPDYKGSITLVALNTGGAVISSTIWPSTPATLVSTFRVNNGAVAVEIPGDRTVTSTLDLRVGTLDLGTTADRVMTISDNGTIRRRQGGSVVLNGGSFVFGTNVSVIYEPSLASAGGDLTSGPELPATLKDLTVTRSANVANAVTEISSAVTISGNLTVRNNFASTLAAAITVLGNVTVESEPIATYPLATAPTFAMLSAITFSGTTDQTITVPATGASIGSITIDKPTGKLTMIGGDVSCTGTVSFKSGLVYTGATNSLVLASNVTIGFGSPFSGFVRNVSGTAKSHMVGNVSVPLKGGAIIAYGRNEFPVGDETYYRPVAITIVTPAAGNTNLGISASVKYDKTRPTGIVGLPILNGVSQGTDIARYPDFSWFIKTTGSLGQTQFNLELTAEGYIDFDDVANLRLIRRSGSLTDVGNTWSLQGAQYDNYVINGVPTVVNVNSTGGLIPGGAIYTYGLKSTMVVANPIAAINLTDASKTFTRNLVTPALFTGAKGAISYSVTIDNPAVATAVIASNVLTVTLKVTGTTFITVTGTDAFDGSRISHKVNLSCVSAVEVVGDIIPTDFSLAQNYPNPFNPSTTIRFGLAKEAPVTLEIYNLLGMRVRTLISGDRMSAAFYNIRWDGRDDAGVSSPSGIYIYRIVADKFVSSKKMALVK